MDLKQYYKKLREIESGLKDEDVLVISLDTADGGKAGVVSEVPRDVAAKMILEGRGVLAGEKEKQAYFERQAATKKAAQKAELARRIQVAIIADSGIGTAASGNKSEPGRGK